MSKIIFLGCGYLGYNLTQLLSQTREVKIWGIPSPYTNLPGIVFEEVDVFDVAALDKKDVQDAIVIDTVSLIGNSAVSEDDDLTLQPIFHKYQLLMKQLKEKGAKCFVYFSSGGTVYGDSLKPIPEGALVHPKTLYAKSKVGIEEVIQNSGMPYVILRPSNPYGGYQETGKKQGVIPILVHKALQQEVFEMWVNPDSIRDYIYIDDLAKAIDALVEKGVVNEIVNIGGGSGTTLQTVMDIVEKETGKKIQVKHALSQVPIIQANVLDISKLTALTGFQPTISLQQGIHLEVERIRKELQGQ